MITLLHAAENEAASSQAASGFGNPNFFISLILIYIIIYVIIIRPQSKANKDQANMLKSLAKNDEIVTTGGIHGTIVNVKDQTIVVRVDDGVKLEIDRTAVQRTVKKKNQKDN